LMAGSPSPVTDEQLRELGLARLDPGRGRKE
jgi:hypothetical protein